MLVKFLVNTFVEGHNIKAGESKDYPAAVLANMRSGYHYELCYPGEPDQPSNPGGDGKAVDTVGDHVSTDTEQETTPDPPRRKRLKK